MSHEPSELGRREANLLRWLRLEQVPQGLPEFHGPGRPLTAGEGALNRRRLAAALGESDAYVSGEGEQHRAELAAELAAVETRGHRTHLRVVGE